MIKDLRFLKVPNSKGGESIAIRAMTDKYYMVSVPSGTSKGGAEAVDIPLDVAERKFFSIKDKIIGMDENDIEGVDDFLRLTDGTNNFRRIGGNLALGISLAVFKAAAKGEVWKSINNFATTFPYPLGNVIGGGAHGGNTSIQEFLVAPTKARTIEEAINTNKEIRETVKQQLDARGWLTGENAEKALTTSLDDIKTLEILSATAKNYGAVVGVDVAASQFYFDGRYSYNSLGKSMNPAQQLDFIDNMVKNYKLFYVEDPFFEKDFDRPSRLTSKVKNCIIAGDDLYSTNKALIAKGIEKQSTNGAIIKPNQCGTVSGALSASMLAKKAGFYLIASHRSVETTDNWISDFAVGLGAHLIKTGIIGKEREAKLNRLVEIWNKMEKPRMAKLF
ncbi:MAG: enolase [Candidatus Aenigmarchaeota archaeon]|nr:enolase [Candidatus Aenigmarchaeota archaeon]